MRFAVVSGVVLATLVGCTGSHGRDDAGAAVDSGGGIDASSPPDGGSAPDVAVGIDAGASECDVPSECVLRPRSCCGSCGAPTPEDMIALHRDDEAAYTAAVCEDIGCPECAREWDPYLLATCAGGACAAIDLHQDARTECTTTSDCALAPIECCACGLLSVGQVVAFNPARGSIAQLTCDPDADCPPCVPDYGATTAQCDAGRCVVVP